VGLSEIKANKAENIFWYRRSTLRRWDEYKKGYPFFGGIATLYLL